MWSTREASKSTEQGRAAHPLTTASCIILITAAEPISGILKVQRADGQGQILPRVADTRAAAASTTRIGSVPASARCCDAQRRHRRRTEAQPRCAAAPLAASPGRRVGGDGQRGSHARLCQVWAQVGEVEEVDCEAAPPPVGACPAVGLAGSQGTAVGGRRRWQRQQQLRGCGGHGLERCRSAGWPGRRAAAAGAGSRKRPALRRRPGHSSIRQRGSCNQRLQFAEWGEQLPIGMPAQRCTGACRVAQGGGRAGAGMAGPADAAGPHVKAFPLAPAHRSSRRQLRSRLQRPPCRRSRRCPAQRLLLLPAGIHRAGGQQGRQR